MKNSSSFWQRNSIVLMMLVGLVGTLTLAACNQQSQSTAVGVVEAYLVARVGSDEARLLALSCKAWEGSARDEAASFKSMSPNVTVDELQPVRARGPVYACSVQRQDRDHLPGRKPRLATGTLEISGCRRGWTVENVRVSGQSMRSAGRLPE